MNDANSQDDFDNLCFLFFSRPSVAVMVLNKALGKVPGIFHRERTHTHTHTFINGFSSNDYLSQQRQMQLFFSNEAGELDIFYAIRCVIYLYEQT